ncbi:MAG TPA: inorganic phosphate transporter [Polyangiaceae bacterium]
MSTLLVAVIATALFFDFTNGFHDAANAIGTSISTRALAPMHALLMAAVLEFSGALLSTHIALTVCTGIVVPQVVTLPMVLAGLLAAIVWNLVTWYYGIPSSSSHCLFGGLAGAVFVEFGAGGVKWMGIVVKVLVPTIVSPLLGLIVGFFFNILVMWLARGLRPGKATVAFRRLQLISASGMALSHGLNDAQKTMGIITLALFANHAIATPVVPVWVKLACAVVIALGTFSGGKRIIKTLGSKIVHLTASDGFSAQTAGAGVLQLAANLGLPVSTTHVITASIMGVGAARSLKGVRWGVTRNIVYAWFLTLPISAIIGGLIATILRSVLT